MFKSKLRPQDETLRFKLYQSVKEHTGIFICMYITDNVVLCYSYTCDMIFIT